jgi:hypothetical protein
MQTRDETMAVDRDEAPKAPAEPTTREQTPRFKLIKLEQRIAPGGPFFATFMCKLTI